MSPPHGPFPPPPGAPPAPQRPRVRFRDVVSVAVIGAGGLSLLVCLYFLEPLAAASFICVLVIAFGALIGMD